MGQSRDQNSFTTSFISEIGKMDENDRLNPQKNEAYFQTLSRSQQISFTRRIRFEYEVSLDIAMVLISVLVNHYEIKICYMKGKKG